MTTTLSILASLFTIMGVYFGTTTKWGALWYGLSMPFWWGLMFAADLWGLAPLNVALTPVAARNVWRAWKKVPIEPPYAAIYVNGKIVYHTVPLKPDSIEGAA